MLTYGSNNFTKETIRNAYKDIDTTMNISVKFIGANIGNYAQQF